MRAGMNKYISEQGVMLLPVEIDEHLGKCKKHVENSKVICDAIDRGNDIHLKEMERVKRLTRCSLKEPIVTFGK